MIWLGLILFSISVSILIWAAHAKENQENKEKTKTFINI